MERLTETTNRYLLYIVISYVLVDYMFRNFNIPIMAGLWDEVLLVLIVGLWTITAAVKGIRPVGSKLLLPLLLFYAVVFLSFLIRSSEPQVAMLELRALIQHTFWFFVALNVVSSRQQ